MARGVRDHHAGQGGGRRCLLSGLLSGLLGRLNLDGRILLLYGYVLLQLTELLLLQVELLLYANRTVWRLIGEHILLLLRVEWMVR